MIEKNYREKSHTIQFILIYLPNVFTKKLKENKLLRIFTHYVDTYMIFA